jgi:hypothetical protein
MYARVLIQTRLAPSTAASKAFSKICQRQQVALRFAWRVGVGAWGHTTHAAAERAAGRSSCSKVDK